VRRKGDHRRLPAARGTFATERIYEGFLGRHEDYRTFFHGHTYTGNPLACAAAIATLDVFEQERTMESLQPKIELLERLLAPIAHLPYVKEIRQRGFHGRHRGRGLRPRSPDGTSDNTPKPGAAERSSARWAT